LAGDGAAVRLARRHLRAGALGAGAGEGPRTPADRARWTLACTRVARGRGAVAAAAPAKVRAHRIVRGCPRQHLEPAHAAPRYPGADAAERLPVQGLRGAAPRGE